MAPIQPQETLLHRDRHYTLRRVILDPGGSLPFCSPLEGDASIHLQSGNARILVGPAGNPGAPRVEYPLRKGDTRIVTPDEGYSIDTLEGCELLIVNAGAGERIIENAPTRQTFGQRWAPWLGSIAPVALLLSWQSQNIRYSAPDSCDYTYRALQILESAKRGGIRDGLHALYHLRSWKGFILPNLFAPFLLLTQGEPLPAIKIFTLAWFLVFLTYVFRLFSSFLPRTQAAVAVLLAGSLPWLWSAATGFDSDLPYLAALVAALDHGIRSRHFSLSRHALASGLWLGLACCIRPIEVATLLGVPFLIYLWHCREIGMLRRADLIAASAAIGIPMLTGAFAAHPGWNGEPVVILLAVPAILVAALLGFHRQLRLATGFARFLAAVVSLAAGWWLPYSRTLFLWAYEGAFGHAAQVIAPRAAGLGPVSFFFEAYASILGVGFLLLAAIASVGGLPKGRWIPADTRARRERLRLLAGLASMCILPVLIGSGTRAGLYRYFFAAAGTAAFALIAYALRADRPAIGTRTILATGLAGLQLLSVQFETLGSRYYVFHPARWFFPVAVSSLVPERGDVPAVLLEKIEDRLGHPSGFLRIGVIGSQWPFWEAINPWYLDLLSYRARRARSFKWVGLSPDGGSDLTGYDYVLAGSFPLDQASASSLRTETRWLFKIESAESAHRLPALGLEKIAAFEAEGPQGQPLRFLLLKTRPVL